MQTQLQDLLHAAGLTRVSREIEQVALPSIRLHAQRVDETQLKLGNTRIGGAPDVPQQWRWPEYRGSALPFVGQISLAEMAPYVTEPLLPATGILSFFLDVDAFFKTWPGDPAIWRVCYDRSAPFALQRLAMPDTIPQEKRYYPCAVTCALEWTIPDYSQYDPTSLQRLGLSQPLTDEEEEAYNELHTQLTGTVGAKYHAPLHRFLGHPDDVQWDMHVDLAGPATDWFLLLQVDSDDAPGTDWGDIGRIYYWIRTQDLLQGDFSQVQLLLQST